MKYGYEKEGQCCSPVYPMHPALENNLWIPAFIIGNGYQKCSSESYDTFQECMNRCKIHNDYRGWSQEEVDAIFDKSLNNGYRNF